jgi:hypothetical protein
VFSSQIEKECITREPTFKKYLAHIRRMENYFKDFIVEHIEWNKNTEADKLGKAVVFFQIIEDASVKTVEPEPRLINTRRGGLASTHNGIPLPLLWARQPHRAH